MPILLPLLLLLQITPVQPLPKGTGLPPPNTEEAGVMRPVNATFAAIAARDGEMLRSVVREDGNLTIATEAADGTRAITHRTMAQFIANLKAGPERFEERLYDPAIEIDGDIAYVWGRFNFYIDAKSAPLTDEQIFATPPDVIAMSWCGVKVANYRSDVVSRRPGWQQVPAVRDQRIVAISEEFLGRPGPRVVEGYRQLRAAIAAVTP